MSRGSRKDRLSDRDRPVGRAAYQKPKPSEQDLDNDLRLDTGSKKPKAGLRDTFYGPGRGLVIASWAGTGLLVATVVLGLLALDTVAPFVVAVSVAMFVMGTVAFFIAYAGAIGRSRYELIGIGGLYFMADSAPTPIRRAMMISFGVELVAVLVAVIASPFSSLVFTSLAPIYALGMAGWWTSKYGSFPRRLVDRPD